MPLNWVSPREYSSASQTLEQQMNNSSMGNNGEAGSVGTVGCGELQSLSLSISPGSQSSCVTAPSQISPTGTLVNKNKTIEFQLGMHFSTRSVKVLKTTQINKHQNKTKTRQGHKT
ncbi:AP2 ethylene-responsive transcription factor ANT [Trifolium repens]|nr:AP2 ethylene-responsive transcription factor ANT [Trifolium repens]